VERAYRARGEEPPEHDEPRPLPANRAAWRAWLLVQDARVATFAGLGGLDWAAVARILELYGLWCRDVHWKLRVCIAELLRIEAEQRAVRSG